MSHSEVFAAACGDSPEAKTYLETMLPWVEGNPEAMDALIQCAETLKGLFPAPATKMCDPSADWYKATTVLANLLRPKGWWVVTYMAPFTRMGMCGKVFFVHLPTKTVLYGKRAAAMRDQPGTYDLPAGNWDAGELAGQTANREAGDEIGWCVPFDIPAAPFMAEVRYLDYGGEKHRAHMDMCYMVFCDVQFMPEPNAEMDGWAWLTAEQILGDSSRYMLGFKDTVNGDACAAAYGVLNQRAGILQLASVAGQRVLTSEEVANVVAFTKAA